MSETLKIQFVVGEQTVPATLADNATARDFLALLPLTVTLDDYANTEKTFDLPKRLSKDGAPTGYAAKKGDITYYAPWGNIAIFYRDFGHASGLIHFGTIDGDLQVLLQAGSTPVTIERVD